MLKKRVLWNTRNDTKPLNKPRSHIERTLERHKLILPTRGVEARRLGPYRLAREVH